MAAGFLTLVLTSQVIRRLNDLGHGYLWAAYFPIFFPRLAITIGQLPWFLLHWKIFSPAFDLFGGYGLFRYVYIAGTVWIVYFLACLMSVKSAELGAHTSVSENMGDMNYGRSAFITPGKVALAALAIILAALNVHKANHPFEYYRYRMVVTVETPEGLKTGSAVRQGNFEEGSGRPASWAVGEAVMVDLGFRGVLFAQIDNSNIGDGVSYTAKRDLSGFGKKDTPVGTRWVLSPEDYPELVMFTDVSNPKTMQRLLERSGNSWGREPVKITDHFEEMFGAGVKLKEITLEITDSDVTTVIEKKLPWLSCGSQEKNYTHGQIFDSGSFKRQPRGYYLEKMKSSKKEAETPACIAFHEQWAAYDRKKFQDDLQHWRQLADSGNAEGQFETGNLIAKGDGHDIKPNRAEAVKWYIAAANQDYQDAQAKLAGAYISKYEGVEVNWQEAYFWANLAFLGTGGHAANNLSGVLDLAPSHITPEQMAAVELRVVQWKPVRAPDAAAPVADIPLLSEKLFGAAYEGRGGEIIKLLVDRGADVNVKNSGGMTPLMMASTKGNVDVVNALLEKGADINARDSHKRTALFMAARGGHGNVAKILLDKGIDVTAVDKDGHTAQQEAKNSNQPGVMTLIDGYLKK